MTNTVLMVDDDLQRLTLLRERLRGHGFELVEATSHNSALAKAEHAKPDVVLLRVCLGLDLFHKIGRRVEQSGAFIAPFLERGFSAELRKEVLDLKADGFINDESPSDEMIAAINVFIRKKHFIDEMKAAILRGYPVSPAAALPENRDRQMPNPDVQSRMVSTALRDRAPEVYQDVLRRYEEGVKLVLQNRIYKINDDIFEPFRLIAKQLFQADATARDAVELHYQTLRKIAPTADAPGARAYLEVGRTTIIGLMGDLITCYRHASRAPEVLDTKTF